VDAEVVGDDLYVQEPKDEQRESDHADECKHNQDQARESVGREVSAGDAAAARALRAPAAVWWPSDEDLTPPGRLRLGLRPGLDAIARGDVFDRPRNQGLAASPSVELE
jgi:hypothetical protein